MARGQYSIDENCFRLTNGTLHGLQQAETVDLSRNRLTSIGSGTFTGFHHLKDLNLSHNRIRVLRGGSFRGCLTVQTLKMSGSGVRIIQPNAFDDLVSIAELDLRDNDLLMPDIVYEIGRLSSLRSLTLSGNDMSNLTRGQAAVPSYLGEFYSYDQAPSSRLPSLKGLESLKNLQLENCNLTHVGRELFGDNTELETIRLGGNNLTTLPAGMITHAKTISFLE